MPPVRSGFVPVATTETGVEALALEMEKEEVVMAVAASRRRR